MTMVDTDLLLMTLCIFLPSAFALVLLFFPRGSEEYMRWWTLLGTAVTFVVSMILFIDYLRMLDTYRDEGQAKAALASPALRTGLDARGEAATADLAQGNPRKSDDLIGRVPWISRFNIDYYLGIDGISMPLVLLTTLLFVLAMVASWNIPKYTKGYCALF